MCRNFHFRSVRNPGLGSLQAATKHAVEGYSESLDHELRTRGLRVSVIEPANTNTQFDANLLEPDAKLDTYREARAAVGDRLKELIESADQPSVVADTVLKAAVAARPKLRYSAGGRASFLQLLRRFGPATLVGRRHPEEPATCRAASVAASDPGLREVVDQESAMTDLIKRYLEDFEAGQTFRSGRIGIDGERIKSFAAEFDPQPFHLDERAASDSIFGGLAASGWHTAAITMRLLVEGDLKPAGGIVGAGFDEFRWPRPVRPGDELRVESEVLEVRASKSRPDQGVIKVRTTTLNQDNQPVQVFVGNLIVPRRPARAS